MLAKFDLCCLNVEVARHEIYCTPSFPVINCCFPISRNRHLLGAAYSAAFTRRSSSGLVSTESGDSNPFQVLQQPYNPTPPPLPPESHEVEAAPPEATAMEIALEDENMSHTVPIRDRKAKVEVGYLSHSLALVTSALMAMDLTPFRDSSWATSFAFSSWMSTTAIAAPASPRACAYALPMPWPAPASPFLYYEYLITKLSAPLVELKRIWRLKLHIHTYCRGKRCVYFMRREGMCHWQEICTADAFSHKCQRQFDNLHCRQKHRKCILETLQGA